MARELSKFKQGAVATGEFEGVEWFILNAPFESALNGYCVFPSRLTRERGYNGILTYVPVHGGITFADEFDGGMVYGFDTLHYDSATFPRTDRDWIRGQIEVMIRGIRKAAEVEEAYLLSRTNEEKAIPAQAVSDIGEPDQRMNFGVTLNLLSGNL